MLNSVQARASPIRVDSAVTAIVKPKVVAKISRVLLLNKIKETSDISASIARLNR
jgi:hypothetical protein